VKRGGAEAPVVGRPPRSGPLAREYRGAGTRRRGRRGKGDEDPRRPPGCGWGESVGALGGGRRRNRSRGPAGASTWLHRSGRMSRSATGGTTTGRRGSANGRTPSASRGMIFEGMPRSPKKADSNGAPKRRRDGPRPTHGGIAGIGGSGAQRSLAGEERRSSGAPRGGRLIASEARRDDALH